ncbi:hypothetical protein RIF29_38063 [Crotalaria pallida]|uniref:Uncharacterized protein n=1 Tax=Crotalaria pallida TaxID=3830 RepID=A0AAN9HL69_CROPI
MRLIQYLAKRFILEHGLQFSSPWTMLEFGISEQKTLIHDNAEASRYFFGSSIDQWERTEALLHLVDVCMCLNAHFPLKAPSQSCSLGCLTKRAFWLVVEVFQLNAESDIEERIGKIKNHA